jgi:tRNA modification GTPase
MAHDMFSTTDTIVAIATPPGRGGLGVVRISGPSSAPIASALLERTTPLRPRHATYARVRGIDNAVVTFFAGPHSYTGEDTLEISLHGSPVVLRTIVNAALDAGARLAEPGEFTFRAFLHGRLDLVQSEAVADLIDAVTPLQARAAFDQLEGTLTRRIRALDAELFDLIARLEASLDFPDEGYHFIEPAKLCDAIRAIREQVDALRADAGRGRLIREGAQVAIVGRANAGKSSVFNQLAGQERAIVTDVPGTTRDLVTERVDVNGVPITLVDTAGFRESADLVEREGIARARQAIDVADLLLVVVDRSEAVASEDTVILQMTEGRPRVVLANKSDRPAAWSNLESFGACSTHPVSAKTGEGFSSLRAQVVSGLISGRTHRDTPAISNIRHIRLLDVVSSSLRRAEEATGAGIDTPEEFVLTDLQQARIAFEEITGTRAPDDVLKHIFERFCIGK